MDTLDYHQQFNDLYNKNFAFAMKLTRNRNDARDLMQETALKVFSNMDKFQENSNFKAWVSTILRNNFINHYRKKVRRKTVELPIEEYLPGSDNLINNEGPSNIRYMELQKIIDKIDTSFREPFMLYHQGYQYQEIAKMLDLPLGTVKSRIFFARRKIRSKMETADLEDYKNIKAFRGKLLKAS